MIDSTRELKDLYYSGRKYVGDHSTLGPADEYKSRKTLRYRHLHSRHLLQVGHLPSTLALHGTPSKKSTTAVPKPKLDTMESGNNRKTLIGTTRLNAKRTSIIIGAPPPGIVIMERDWRRETERCDWREKTQAGCKIWVNQRTREVLNYDPWARETNESDDDDVVAYDDKSKPPRNTIDEGHELGTGALVYNGTEVLDLLDMLDAMS
jgi:hypothetical protein